MDPWRRGDRSNPGPERKGLDSIRFDTLGLTRQPDDAPNERRWLGHDLVLSENWFPIPPDLPSLDEQELRRTYDALLADQRYSEGRTPRLLHLAVHGETPVPAVCTLIRMVLPDDHRYTFISAITLPLAECSWVVKVQSSEGQWTGLRETLAGVRYSRENPTDDRMTNFDPYDAQWDSDEHDPLTSVRQSMDRVLASLDVDAELLQAIPFRS